MKRVPPDRHLELGQVNFKRSFSLVLFHLQFPQLVQLGDAEYFQLDALIVLASALDLEWDFHLAVGQARERDIAHGCHLNRLCILRIDGQCTLLGHARKNCLLVIIPDTVNCCRWPRRLFNFPVADHCLPDKPDVPDE